MVDSKDDAFAMSPMERGMEMFGESAREASRNLFRDWLMIGPELFDHYAVRRGQPAQPPSKGARSVPKA